MGCQRIIADYNDQVNKAAGITADNVMPSTEVFLLASARIGRGSVSLSGGYTGAATADFDLEITDLDGTGRASKPLFRGVGSGSLSNIAPGSLAAQQVTITLKDLGITTTHAEAPLYGVTLRAKATGEAGNDIAITVDESSLAFNLSPFTVFETIAVNAPALVGPQNDFAAVSLDSDGALPAAAPRFRFAGDPQIFRQYRLFTGDHWEYHLVPTPPREIPKGAAVETVTGAYAVTISNGSTTETYSITTLYDLLAGLVDSALVEVVGAVVKDLQPGGMATIDLPLKTGAYHLPVQTSGTYCTGLDDIAISNAALTEILAVKCIDNRILGSEIWQVSGSGSGALPQAQTAQPWASSPYGFTIPRKLLETINPVVAAPDPVRLINSAPASSTIRVPNLVPPVCVKKGVIGAAGTPSEITLVWTKYENQEDCSCENISVRGSVKGEYLGLTTDPGGGAIVALDAELKSRLAALYALKTALLNYGLSQGGYATYTVHYCQFVGGIWVDSTKVFYYEAAALDWATNHCHSETLDGSGQSSYFGMFTESVYTSAELHLPASPEANAYGGSYILKAVVDKPVNETMTLDATEKAIILDMVDIMHACLDQIYTVPSACTLWDTLLSDIAGEMTAILEDSVIATANPNYTDWLERYRSRCEEILIDADIEPGKSDGSNTGAGCWTDMKQDYWALEGYAPIYNNILYYSTKFDSSGKPYSTMEFAFALALACAGDLVYGDTIRIAIGGGGNSAASRTYQPGDSFTIPVIAATPLRLDGGRDGDDTITWGVRGSVAGALDDYQVLNNDPAPYSDTSGFSFTMALGGIPFALGDSFSLAIEGGHFRWRKAAGAWQSGNVIADTALSDGLTAVFAAGAGSSFAAGDAWTFRANQPNAPAAVAVEAGAWSFTGASGALTINFGAARNIDIIALTGVVLPTGGTLTLERSANCSTWSAVPAPVTARQGVLISFQPAALSLQYLKITCASCGSAGAAIGRVYAGLGLTTDISPEKSVLSRTWDMARGPKPGLPANLIRTAWIGEIGWSMMSADDFAAHLAMIEEAKLNNDSPIIFVPHHLYPAEAALVRINADNMELTDEFHNQPDDDDQRLMAMNIPLGPAWI